MAAHNRRSLATCLIATFNLCTMVMVTMTMFKITKCYCIDGKAVALSPDNLDWTTPLRGGRRKITDLPEDCYNSDGTTMSDVGSDLLVGRRTTAARQQTRDGEVGKVWSSTSMDNESLSMDNESLKTPDSLLTSELLDDSLFDGELDWIGQSAWQHVEHKLKINKLILRKL